MTYIWTAVVNLLNLYFVEALTHQECLLFVSERRAAVLGRATAWQRPR
jgi:hypothetical protein